MKNSSIKEFFWVSALTETGFQINCENCCFLTVSLVLILAIQKQPEYSNKGKTSDSLLNI